VQYGVDIQQSEYDFATNTISIKHLPSDDDGFDDPVILHEDGHFAANSISLSYNQVGGPHQWD
jgi:hypothetical protein